VLPIIATVLVVRFILDLMDQLLPRPLRPERAARGAHSRLARCRVACCLAGHGLLVTETITQCTQLVRCLEDFMNASRARAVYGGSKAPTSDHVILRIRYRLVD